MKKIILGLRLLFLSTLYIFSTFIYANNIENIRYNRINDKVQIVLDISSPMPFQQFSLASPPRIVLDFPNTQRIGNAGLVINEGSVSSVRSGIREPDTVRIVIDLIASSKANIYALTPSNGAGHRIVIDIYDFDSTPTLALTSIADDMPFVMFAGKALEDNGTPSNALNFTPTPSGSNNISIEREISSTGQVQSRSEVPTSAMKRDIMICIDPGHGGKDPGAVNSALNLREKDLVLAIAKRLKKHIDLMPGYRTTMTRSTDRFIPLRERTAACRKANGDLFISIHADAVESSGPSGSSVYILSTRGASSQTARYLANQENAVDLKWGVDVSKYDDEIQEALLSIQLEATLESSHVLAGKTINELSKIGKVHKSNVERANFVVLRSPEIPSMLVETAFISNNNDARRLNTAEYQEKLARAIASSVNAYFREHLPQHMLLNQ